MKRCSKCYQDKPEEEFGKCGKVKSGLAAECKACARARAKAWWTPERIAARQAKPGYHEARRRYYQANKAKLAEKAKTPEARKRAYAAQQRWRVRNRIKQQAHHAVRYRVRTTKELPPPETLSCSDCGSPAVEYHHDDYGKPLDVVAVCKPCHAKKHHKYTTG